MNTQEAASVSPWSRFYDNLAPEEAEEIDNRFVGFLATLIEIDQRIRDEEAEQAATRVEGERKMEAS